jgi:hypothetical protein
MSYAELSTKIRYLPLKSRLSGIYNLDFFSKLQKSRLKAIFLVQQGIWAIDI